MLAPGRPVDPDLDQVEDADRAAYAFSRIVAAMTDSDLRNLLSQLHARLGNSQSLDDEDRRLLITILGDIDKVLSRDQGATPAASPDTSGLESLAVKFEADHPALAEGIRRLADTLAKAGI